MFTTVALTLTMLAAPTFPVTAHLVAGAVPQVELKNTGNRAVTAWNFAVVSPTATGTHREEHSADVYLSEVTRDLPHAPQHLDWLRPGESRTIPVDAAPAGATVEIVALVFDDGTTMGDPKAIAAVFAHRATERDQLKKVVDTFNASLQSHHGAAALEELRQRFAAGGDESVPNRSAREAVESWIEKTKGAPDDQVDQSIRTYAAFVTKQYEAAAKHAQRKGNE
jgi:hypothetical protein